MLPVIFNWMWISLTIKSLSCFQLVAIRERTFVLKWREGNREVWSFVPSRLDLAENMDIWKDNGQKVRRSGGRICQNEQTVPSPFRLYSPESGKLAPEVRGEVLRVKPCVFLLQGLGQKHPPLKGLSGTFKDFLVRSDCLLWTKAEHKSERPLTQGVDS